ncbi:MAG: 50S ribosomal protein L29 [Candidatus Dormibacteraeota bacterium]|nr:50S ribosomal protein L29 [Candidatus Dormibacteraeota bacterium]
MKVDELRVLEADELGGRLKAARRELYELRFKHAVGQLENSSQISKVRHDIARIMTVLQEREFGIVAQVPPDAITVAVAEAEPEEAPEASQSVEETKPKRGRAKATKPKADKGS